MSNKVLPRGTVFGLATSLLLGLSAQTTPNAPPTSVPPVTIPDGERYDRAFTIVYSGPRGASGMDGRTGSTGLTGSAGMDGSTGPSGSVGSQHPKPGGRGGSGGRGGTGSTGGRGSDGDRGKPGGDGPDVKVEMTLGEGDVALLRIRVWAKDEIKDFLVDPKGGSLTVRTEGGAGGRGGRGGNGGRGGDGGRGGRGGRGGFGSPNGSSGWAGSTGLTGSTGSSGFDGQSGPSGRGGAITGRVSPKAKAYLGVLRLENPGGPAPVIQEADIAL